MRSVLTTLTQTAARAASGGTLRTVVSRLFELGGLAALVLGVGELAGDAWQLIAGGTAAIVYAIGLERGTG